jgi:hypothetical protein
MYYCVSDFQRGVGGLESVIANDWWLDNELLYCKLEDVNSNLNN